MTEKEFDARMDETGETCQYWRSELGRLQELGDNQAKIEAGLDYATELLTTLQGRLSETDQTPDELWELTHSLSFPSASTAHPPQTNDDCSGVLYERMF
jgi:hypothetical protein